MRAFRVRRHGDLSALEPSELERPRPAAGEALIRVHACGLNHLDLWLRRGVPGHEFPLPLVPGAEISGTVAELGPGVTGFDPGEAVLVAPGVSCGTCRRCLAGEDPLCRDFGILGETRDGGYAEYAAVPGRNLMRKPANLSFAEAAAVPLVFLTAWHMLEARARLRAFESVLVHAAGSGVSSAAIQIARLFGARTIVATAGSDEKLERARELGATHVANYRSEDFVKIAKQATGGAGVDVVVDHVGGEIFERSLRAMARGGRIVLCGATAGAEAKVNLRAVFFKGLSILGSTMGSLEEMKRLLRHFETGELRPILAETFPLERAREAQAALESRQAFGKIVLTMGDAS